MQVYADPDSCNRFYKCENGTMSLDTCENGLLFDQVTGTCLYYVQFSFVSRYSNYIIYQCSV